MYDCPRCSGVETLRYNLYYDVFICLACGVTAAEDDSEQIVTDHVMKNNDLVVVTEYILPLEEAQEAEINYNVLEHLRNSRTTKTDRGNKRATRNRRTRKDATTGDVADQAG